MTFEEKLKNFVDEIPEKIKHINSEETTKIALIMPLLRIMGYDTTDPRIVQLEFTADIGTKKGEKIDIAIFKNDEAEILIECKPCMNELDENHISQLYRYYNITNSKIGILTNGIVYKFFTDTKSPGKMDNTPFLEINLNDLQNRDIIQLEKFSKEKYDVDKISDEVDILKYSNDIKNVLNIQIDEPNDEFVRVIAKEVYEGVLTKKPRDLFRKIIQKTFKEIINDRVDKALQNAIKNGEARDDVPIVVQKPEVETTNEELEAYYILRSIISEITDSERVTLRDRKSYCGVLLDNNQNYPINRLYFNNINKLAISFFDKFEKTDNGSKIEDKVPIKSVKEIYDYKDRIIKTVRHYDRLKNAKKK